MQAQLTFRRLPSIYVVALFALAAALLLGGTLGSVLKPATMVSGPALVVVVHDESGAYATGGASALPTAASGSTTYGTGERAAGSGRRQSLAPASTCQPIRTPPAC